MPEPPKPWLIWNAVIDKVSDVGIAALSNDERVIYLVNRFLCDFENGGYSGFLYNVSASESAPEWRELRDTADALSVLHSQKAADVLRETADLMENSTPVSALTWAEYMAAVDPSGKTREFDRVLEERRDEFWERLEAFTRAHTRAGS
jgi:Domain of unknown function (DUF4375)